jgi:hypothetical protein
LKTTEYEIKRMIDIVRGMSSDEKKIVLETLLNDKSVESLGYVVTRKPK